LCYTFLAAHSLAGGAVETAQKVIGTFPFLNGLLRFL
jgi:hypothetical protein